MREELKGKTEKELRKSAEEYAEKAGINLNPDEKVVSVIFRGLLRNKEKHGKIYCPCRIITGNKKKDKEIICPCVFHMEEIKQDRQCKCGLFVIKDIREI